MNIHEYFKTPIWAEDKPEFVKSLNKASDKYIKEARKTQKDYIKKYKNKNLFKNLTLAPIDTDLVNFKLLNKEEKNYLSKYHLEVYSKISKFLDSKEKKWLLNLI